MADATISTIRAAILTRLLTLKSDAPTPGPFRYVGEWAGEAVGGRADQRPDQQALGNTPAAQLTPLGEDANAVRGTRTLAEGSVETVGATRWVVIVTTTDVRSASEVAADTTHTSIWACIDAVIAALHGLRIAGLYQEHRLTFDRWRPGFVRNGVYVYLVEFRAERPIGATTNAADSVPLTRITGALNMTSAVVNPANPPDPDPNFAVLVRDIFP